MTINLDAVTAAISPQQVRSIVEATARINIWEGSVRSGKTIASLLRWLIYVSDPPPGGELAMFGKTRETLARNIFAPLQNRDLFGEVAHAVKYTPGAPTASVLGRTVHVLGGNDAKAEAKVRGMTLVGAYIDEATIIPEDMFTQILARLSVTGAKLFTTTNPDGPAHWLRKKFLLRAAELNLASWRFRLDDNPSLDPEYVFNLKREYTGLWYRRFILGDWCLAEGAIYDMWDPDRHVVKALPPIDRWIVAGVDYGTVNPFAAVLCGLGRDPRDRRTRLYVAGEWRWDSKLRRRQMTDAEYATALVKWFGDFPVPGTNARGVRPEWVCVDPSAASFVTELLTTKRLTPSLADNSVCDGIRSVSSLLGASVDGLRVHESCTGLIDEIPGYSWDDDKAEKGIDEPVKVDDHSADALRYAVHTTRPVWRSQLALAA